MKNARIVSLFAFIVTVFALTFAPITSVFAYTTSCEYGRCVFNDISGPLTNETILQFTFESPNAQDITQARFIKGTFPNIDPNAKISFSFYEANNPSKHIITHTKIANDANLYFFFDLNRDGVFVNNTKYIMKVTATSAVQNVDVITRTSSWESPDW